MTVYVKVPAKVVRDINDLVKSYANKAMVVTIDNESDPSKIVVTLTGFGLLDKMVDVFKGEFSSYMESDFRSIESLNDCFKGFEFNSSAVVIIDTYTMSAPSIEVVYHVQKVAGNRYK